MLRCGGIGDHVTDTVVRRRTTCKGKSEEQIRLHLDAGYKSGEFKAPTKPGIVYMMSEQGVLLVSGKQLVPIPPHLMFYAPYATDKDLGSPPAGTNMPRVIRPGQPDAYIIVVPRWPNNIDRFGLARLFLALQIIGSGFLHCFSKSDFQSFECPCFCCRVDTGAPSAIFG